MAWFLVCTGLLICLVSSSTAGFAAQAPSCVCTPETFVVTDGSLVALVNQNSTRTSVISFSETILLGFDYNSQMSGMFVNVTFFDGAPSYRYQVITDYHQKKQWLIEPETKMCTKTYYPTHMQRCVPDDAIYTGSFYQGTKDLYGEQWYFNVSKTGIKGVMTIAFQQESCVPLSETFVGRLNGEQVTVATGFFNYVQEVPDASKFYKLPDYCSLTTNPTRKADTTRLYKYHSYHALHAGNLFL